MSEPISLCACMGPIKGEPMCPCRMKAAGLRTSEDYEWTPEEKEAFRKALEPFCQQNRENNEVK
jgi:hypothetical protein